MLVNPANQQNGLILLRSRFDISLDHQMNNVEYIILKFAIVETNKRSGYKDMNNLFPKAEDHKIEEQSSIAAP